MQAFFHALFYYPETVVKTQSWIEFLNSIYSLLFENMKIWNYKANYLLPKPIIFAYKLFGALSGPIHSMFHHL